MEKIKEDVEFLKNLVLEQMPEDPPRTFDGDIPLSDVKKELMKQIDTE